MTRAVLTGMASWNILPVAKRNTNTRDISSTECVPAMEYADRAFTYGFCSGASLVIDATETLQDPGFISDDNLMKLRYDALRYGNEDQLDYVIRNKETYIEMGYGDQIEKVWIPLWKKKHPEAKTQVSPSAIIIQPSGIASVVEADI